MTQYVLYPRGFIAPAFDPSIQKEEIVAHPLINALVRSMYVEPNKVHTPDFHKQILILAKEVFQDPINWLNLQKQSPYLSNRHVSFLKEVADFILKGENRLSYLTWNHLLTGSHDHKQRFVNKVVLDEKAFDELMTQWKIIVGKGQTTTNLIQAWVSQHNGYHHLLMTLNMLLGEDESLVRMEKAVIRPGA